MKYYKDVIRFLLVIPVMIILMGSSCFSWLTEPLPSTSVNSIPFLTKKAGAGSSAEGNLYYQAILYIIRRGLDRRR